MQLFLFLDGRNNNFVFLFCLAKSSPARAFRKPVQDVEASEVPHVRLHHRLRPPLPYRSRGQSLLQVLFQPVKALGVEEAGLGALQIGANHLHRGVGIFDYFLGALDAAWRDTYERIFSQFHHVVVFEGSTVP